MTTATQDKGVKIGPEIDDVPRTMAESRTAARASGLTSEAVWDHVARGSFAIISYITPSGAPRSSGVMYKAVGRRLYVAVAPESWKARHIVRTGSVAVTVPVRRGGVLSLVLPIPPATVSFHGTAMVHKGDSPQVHSLSKELADLLPAERRASSAIIEIVPEGAFVTYGVGVSLSEMRDAKIARARVPVTTGRRSEVA